MDIVISNNSEKPIYLQIFEQVSSQILSGHLAANFCLPSIRSVALELGISIITIKTAWEKLESEGFIYTKSGKGCYVAEFKKQELSDKKLGIATNRIALDVRDYKDLGLELDEIIDIVKKCY